MKGNKNMEKTIFNESLINIEYVDADEPKLINEIIKNLKNSFMVAKYYRITKNTNETKTKYEDLYDRWIH